MAAITEEFKNAVREEGLLGGLRWLNARVPHRFSAVFAFESGNLRNLALVDKEDPGITRCEDQPVSESYCVYVQQTERAFEVENALSDARVAGHPKQRTIPSYYGIPLVDGYGKLLGTVCHFDRVPVQVTETVVSELDDLAPLIADVSFRQGSK